MTIWTEVLTEMKKSMKPSGVEKVQKIMDSLKQFDKMLAKKDLRSLKSNYLITAKSMMDLKPHVKNSKLATACSDSAKACEKMAKDLKNGASMKDVAAFEKGEVLKLLAAMK